MSQTSSSLRALLLVCALALSTAAAADRALLALDKVVSGPYVHTLNVTVTYTIHNVGTAPATALVLRDKSYPASRFTVSRTPRANWPELAPGASESLSIAIAPRRTGELYTSAASVQYLDGDTKRSVSVLAADDLVVEDLLSYRRRTEKHQAAWLAFLAAFVALSVAPFSIASLMIRALPSSSSAAEKRQ